jgi:hypothetical protein
VIAGLAELIQKLKAARDMAEHHRGFDFAAGKLLRGVSAADLQAAVPSRFSAAFDMGMLDAIDAWNARKS